MARILLVGASAIAFTLSASAASAQGQFGSDACNDILRNGTMRIEQFKDNRYFRQITASREVESRRRTSNIDTSGSVGMPIQGVPFQGSGASSYDRADLRSSDVSRFSSISEDRVVSSLLSTGDPVIVSEWGRCMDNGPGGLSVRFLATSAREATLMIAWRPGRVGSLTGFTEAHLSEDIVMPEGVEVLSGRHCLLAATPITEGSCAVGLRLSSATRDLAVVLNTDRRVVARAYLPPRLTHRLESQPYSFSAADRIERSFKRNEGVWVPHTVQLNSNLANAGWRFDPDSVSFTVEKTSGTRRHYCRSASVTRNEPHQISYRYRARTSFEDSDDRNTSVRCIGTPSARLIRDRWDPME